MKREQLLSLLFTLVSLNAISQQFSSQWQWLNPKPSGFNNNKVCFSDSSHGFIFNDNGDLIRTTDGGDHWTIQQQFPNAKALDIHDSTGIIAGFSNAVYISTNNGNTWQKKVITASQNPYFPFVQAVSRDTLLALNSNNSTLHRSTDRGTTWTTILTNTLLNNNLSFHFVNSRTGFLGGYGGIQKTNDGGITWQPVYTNSSWGILAIRFFNENLGYAFRDDDKLLKTTDGGLTWTTSGFYLGLFSFFFTNANTIYAAGDQARIYKSTDGGVNWSVVSPPSIDGGFRFSSIYFVNDNKGFVVGSSGKILSTTDAGVTWKQYGVTHIEITTIYFPSAQVGYATDWSSAYKSTDGGQTWQPANLTLAYPNGRFTHSWFRNKDTGFIIARDPALFYKTKDGGQTWQTINPLGASYENALSLDFVNDTTGYLCMSVIGGSSRLFKTNDAGETWVDIGYSYNVFKQLKFLTGKTGYGVTNNAILKTVDSAQSWQPVLTTNNYGFNGVHFINGAVGYSFGDNALIKKTIDSGATWSTINVPYGHIEDIHFFNEQVGYMVSQSLNHGVFKTYDGGNTWHPEFNLVLPHTAATSDTLMYIAGYGGAILSQRVAGYNLDSLIVKNITACSADFSVYVSVAFGSIDSIRLEWGHSGFTNLIPLTPSSVTNNTIKLVESLQNLGKDTIYNFRLRFFYKGNPVYSEEGSFKTSPLPKPTITVISDTLISSSFFNNQWFLNGQPIAGATGRTLKVTVSGNYTVQTTEQGCVSQLSDPFNFIVTAIDPVLATKVSISPNPTSDNLYIKNNTGRGLEIRITDLYGRAIYSTRSNASVVLVPFKKLAAGLYLVTINEIGKRNSITRKVLRQ